MIVNQLLNEALKQGNMTGLVQAKIYENLKGTEVIPDRLGDLISEMLDEAMRYHHFTNMPSTIALRVVIAVRAAGL